MKGSLILMFVLMASLMFAVGCNTDKQPGTTPSAQLCPHQKNQNQTSSHLPLNRRTVCRMTVLIVVT